MVFSARMTQRINALRQKQFGSLKLYFITLFAKFLPYKIL